MRIFTENTEQYIHALANTLGKDPSSLEAWRCIHIHPHPESAYQEFTREALLEGLKAEYKNADCDVVFCNDHDMLLIGKTPDINIMYQLQASLTQHCTGKNKPEAQIYDLFLNWREIRKILISKVDTNEIIVPPEAEGDFGGVDVLQEVFHLARKVRKARNPLHILLVEDDEMTRRLASSLFRNDYAVFTAKDAQEAIESYFLNAPDIVFLDINLPDKNGFQVLNQILKLDAEAYVVMFSGNSYLDNIMRAMNAGASGFVPKPFSKEKMTHYIQDGAMHHGKSLL